MSDFDHQPNGANMDDPEFVKPVQRPPPPKIPKAVSRTKEVVSQDLRMDDEVVLGQFQNVHTLSVSEARMIVNAVFQQRKEKGKHYKETENMTKMFDYLDMFSRFKQQENITAVEQVLSAHTELAFAERSQLATLVPSEVEEAKSVIPSIANKISDEDLGQLLDEMNKLRQFSE